MTPSFFHLDIDITSGPTVTDVEAVLELARRVDQTARWPQLEPKLMFGFARDVPTYHVFARHADRLVGYAHLAFTASADGPSAEIVVDSEHRLRGVGRSLLNKLRQLASGDFRIWCHGINSAAFSFANRTDLILRQQVVLLRYPDEALICRGPLKNETSLEDANLSLNSLSHAIDDAYPDSRPAGPIMSQDWFTPKLVTIHLDNHGGLDGALVLRPMNFSGQPSMEIHAIAVMQHAQGVGIGRQLISDALDIAATLNAKTVISYVDLANSAALRAHFRSGFEWVSADAIFRGAGFQALRQSDTKDGPVPR